LLKKILLIEDDPSIREILELALNEEGFEVISATNGIDAFNVLYKIETLPSLILCDLRMPFMDGIAFRKEQLMKDEYAAIPFILMTAEKNVPSVKEMGAFAFIFKPMDLEVLLKLVSSKLEVRIS
jgi:two-component system, chemotaxis family, chemotaxis protein CheY